MTLEQHQRLQLADAVRADADAAAKQLCNDVVADLSVDLVHAPSLLVASSDAGADERG